MAGGNVTQPGPGAPAEEIACLRALIAGQDMWPAFFKMFSRFIQAEFNKLGITRSHDQGDLLQELALKLCSHDLAIIRRFLLRDSGFSFRAILRTIIRSIVIDEWRKQAKWRKVVLCEDEPTLQQLCVYRADGDPARELYRETRLINLLLTACGHDNHQGYSIMSLRYVEGLSVDQIGARLGLRPNAVSQRIRYYLRKLRDFGWVEEHDD
jgi:RNA polymerase sigma factor (sigma-70 family)